MYIPGGATAAKVVPQLVGNLAWFQVPYVLFSDTAGNARLEKLVSSPRSIDWTGVWYPQDVTVDDLGHEEIWQLGVLRAHLLACRDSGAVRVRDNDHKLRGFVRRIAEAWAMYRLPGPSLVFGLGELGSRAAWLDLTPAVRGEGVGVYVITAYGAIDVEAITDEQNTSVDAG